MNPSLALFACVIGIGGLFWLNRDTSVRTSKALWVPVIWMSVAGSRSPFSWFGMSAAPDVLGQLPESNWPDQLLASSLMLLGLVVLVRRGKEVTNLLKASWPITLYFAFCLISLVWSDFPLWGLKRWVRALGDVIMLLVVFTDMQPITAFKRLFSRVGFVLLPASILLIRYYPGLGSGWDPWGQAQMFTGVTTNKNVLGNLVYLIGLGVLWQLFGLVRHKEQPDRGRRLLAQGTLAVMGIYLLYVAHCATGNACIILGVGLMFVLSLPVFRRSPAAVHAFILTLALVGGLGYLLGAKAAITEALGRKPDLTGRTVIWKILIEMAPNPVGGAGFETFWLGSRSVQAYALVGGLDRINEAHNGYLEAYLNLGVLGLGFIALIIGQSYLKAVAVFRRDPALGGLLIAYAVTVVTYNITEAGFRMLHLEWFFLLLSVVAANRFISLADASPESIRELAPSVRARWTSRMSSGPARLGTGVKTGISRGAIATRSQGKESPQTQFLAGSKKSQTRTLEPDSSGRDALGICPEKVKHKRSS